MNFKRLIISVILIFIVFCIFLFLSLYLSEDNTKNSECLNNNAQSCYDLANFYFDNANKKYNIKKSIYYLEKACELSYPNSCVELGYLYLKNSTILKENEAINYIDKICQNGDLQTCYEIAARFVSGNRVYENIENSLLYFENLCEKNYKQSCFFTGLIYSYDLINQNENKAIKYFDLACKNNNYVACLKLGEIYIMSLKNENIKEAINSFNKACYFGKKQDACYILGHIYSYMQGYKDYYQALKYYEKACSFDSSKCNILAYLFSSGKGNIPRNQKRAFEIYKNSCDKNYDIVSCFNTGLVFQYAKGVEKNLNMAKIYYKKACNFGHKKACQNQENVEDLIKNLEK